MGGFNFDLSGLNPWFQGLTQRTFNQMDERAIRQPMLDAQADRAYREWLKNNEQKRDIALRQQTGQEAAQALNTRIADERSAEAARLVREERIRGDVRAATGHNRYLDTAYGGSSPGGTPAAALSPSFAPLPQPAYGPRDGTTVNVSSSGGGGSTPAYSYGGNVGGGGGGSGYQYGGGGNSWTAPDYWDTGVSDEKKRRPR